MHKTHNNPLMISPSKPLFIEKIENVNKKMSSLTKKKRTFAQTRNNQPTTKIKIKSEMQELNFTEATVETDIEESISVLLLALWLLQLFIGNGEGRCTWTKGKIGILKLYY